MRRCGDIGNTPPANALSHQCTTLSNSSIPPFSCCADMIAGAGWHGAVPCGMGRKVPAFIHEGRGHKRAWHHPAPRAPLLPGGGGNQGKLWPVHHQPSVGRLCKLECTRLKPCLAIRAAQCGPVTVTHLQHAGGFPGNVRQDPGSRD